MAGDFQVFTLEKAEQLSGRLREVLSGGQAYILARFGVDMGLEPDLYSAWIVLSATALVLLLLLAVSWAAVRGGPLLGKTPTTRVGPRSCVPDKAGPAKPVGAEEPKKRNKKKTVEKKTLSNGQPVNLTAPALKPKKDKTEQQPVQAKKNKKKVKIDVKPAQPVTTNDWKEPDEGQAGTWETKVSNREKKKKQQQQQQQQQRRKDKISEDSCSPGGPEAPKAQVETPVVTATAKKNRGNNESRATGKSTPATTAASPSRRGEPSVVDDDDGGGWTSVSAKKTEQKGSGRKPVHAAPHPSVPQKQQSWTQETQAAAAGRSSTDARGKTGPKTVSFSLLGCNATETPSNSAELQWASQKEANGANDDWSGFARAAPADPSSDWYAPVEHWGNYEGVAAMAAPPRKPEPAATKVSESDKNGDDPSDGAAGAKKRRRRKRTTEGEGAAGVQAVKLSAAPADVAAPVSTSQSPSVSSQKGPQLSAQPPKSSQKKKAHREI